MRIPSDAIIPAGKIQRYLLVPRKANDKSKYLARAGFGLTTSEQLASEIHRLTAGADAQFDRANEHGEFYNVIGSLVGPSGMELPVKLVWLRRLDGVFTFVTLVPDTRRSNDSEAL